MSEANHGRVTKGQQDISERRLSPEESIEIKDKFFRLEVVKQRNLINRQHALIAHAEELAQNDSHSTSQFINGGT